jgi:hypothetical protein
MNRRSFVQVVVATGLPVSAGCVTFGGDSGEDAGQPPTPIEDGPGVLVENKLDTAQVVVVEIHKGEEEPPIREVRFELESGERALEPLDIDPGNYIVRAGMKDGPIETLFGDSWSLSDTETMYVEVTRSHIYFEEL